MCDENCGNLKPDRIRCEPCRTINLALHAKRGKPDMQMYDKCTPPPGTCMPVSEMPVSPTCIRVCDKNEFKMSKTKQRVCIPRPPYGHGRLMYGVKAGILLGAVYFTYSQGVWGDQQDVTECIRRWQEYVRSFHTRRPPSFDPCGNVVVKESTDSIIAPVYDIYKTIVTTCFAGIVKLPLVMKCMYDDYLAEIERKHWENVKEKQIKKRG